MCLANNNINDVTVTHQRLRNIIGVTTLLYCQSSKKITLYFTKIIYPNLCGGRIVIDK